MDPRDINNRSSVTSCETEDGAEKALFIVTNVLAVVILIVLSFIHKRVRLFRECLWGFPGIVTPLNLLTTTPFRFIYCSIFGAMSGDIMNFKTLYSRFISPTSNPYLDIFIATVLSPVVVLLYMAAKYFPLFACVEAPIPLVGHILGLIYSCLLVAYNVYDDFCTLYSQWAGRNEAVMWIFVASRIPVYVCYFVVTLWYLFNAVYDLGIICFKGFRRAEGDAPKSRSTIHLRSPWISLFLSVLVYTKLPLRFIGALSVMLVIALQHDSHGKREERRRHSAHLPQPHAEE